MKRVRATDLVMVNWKGVFYARYQLDPRVTALEGVNGAGKTTVLVAAYVAMLPDMARLRFTNVGEHGATGGDKGLWGRLGEAGAPSYTAIEYRLPEGERLVAGVHLQRASEPTVEPTPFLVTGLRPDVPLQELFLDRGDADSVPLLPRFRELVARTGARLELPGSAKDYFAALFERGVLPLRMAGEAERGKFNEMLRATMTGGMSRELTAEGLRRFLLREETGLSETLVRMRASLDSCRVTRHEVETSRRLEQEIRGVYEAGEEMFACAVLDIRERAAESGRRREEARGRMEAARERQAALEREVQTLQVEATTLRRRLEEIRHARDAALQARSALQEARKITTAIRHLEGQRGEVSERVEAARKARDAAERELDASSRVLSAAETDRDAASGGLVNLQLGIEELARRAGEHRVALDRFEAVRARFPEECRGADDLARVIASLDEHIRHDGAELARLQREIATADARQRDFDATVAALARILQQEVPAAGAYRAASHTLAGLREAEQVAADQTRAAAELAEARTLAARRLATLSEAQRLLGSGPFRAAVVDEAKRLDLEIDDLGDRIARARLAASTATDTMRAIDLRIKEAMATGARWREARGRAERLAAAHGVPITCREDAVLLRRRLSDRRDLLRTACKEAESLAASRREEATRLERGGGARDPRLVEARDAAGAELLAERFEDIALEDAATIEALLGPLADALVVEDVRKAAGRILEEAPDRPDTVTLIDGNAASLAPKELPGEVIRDVAFVENGASARLTRIPDVPTLGLRARRKRITGLLKEAEGEDAKAAQAHKERDAVEASLAETELLMPDADLLAREDPDAIGHTLTSERTRCDEEVRKQRAQAASDEEHASRLKQRRADLQRLLPDAWLLDEVDLDERVHAREKRVAAAAKAREHLARVAKDRDYLHANLEALRLPPSPPEEAAAAVERETPLKVTVENSLRVREDASWVAEHRVALEWTDAERALQAKTHLEPALKHQLEQARKRVEAARDDHKRKDERRDAARDTFSQVQEQLRAIDAGLELKRQEVAATGVADTSDEAWTHACQEADRLEAESAQLDRGERELSKRIAVTDEHVRQAAESAETARLGFEEAERAWKPQQERWERLEKDAADRGLLAQALAARYIAKYEGRGSANITAEARSQALVLVERLSRASDGVETVTLLRGILDASTLGERCIEAWTAVRSWIQRRLPSQIADEPDPRLALTRLGENLERLQEKLERQERELRGDSENVARNIENQKRRARKQITLLNHDLEGVRFGSIEGVQVVASQVDHMERVLDALRSGEAQDVLFKPDMPIEQALDELFRRYGGGQTGGSKLLDYREYLDLRVEVRRQGSAKWEVANAVRMSTGEAIGVGASLMMVVLAAWERDAALFRVKRSAGTLRLLFLDEANRLSSDSLAILFELCEGLELQLMLAAPEVAQSHGNTTYRLVRCIGADGREEVKVTGRRAVPRPT